MSNKIQKLLVAVAFAGAAQHAMACGTTPCTSGTNLNLNTTNNNTLTANPNATATGGVASANNNSSNTNNLTANPNATATGGVATVNNNPVTTVTANPTATGGNGYGGTGYGGNSTSNATATGGTGGNGYGGNGYSSAYVGNVAGGSSTTTTTVGNENNITNTNTATTGPSTSQASIATGAVANNINYSSTYKAATSSATAAGVVGYGHGCFEHKGGFGLGVQVLTAGVSGNYNQGETYNKDCAADQAAMAIISKGGNPVNDALAAETAANMSPDVREAVRVVPQSPLLGLFATYSIPNASAAAPAAAVVQQPAPNVRVAPIVETPTCAKGSWNPQLGKCVGGALPSMK